MVDIIWIRKVLCVDSLLFHFICFRFRSCMDLVEYWDKVKENWKIGKMGARVDGQIIHIMNILIHLLLNLVEFCILSSPVIDGIVSLSAHAVIAIFNHKHFADPSQSRLSRPETSIPQLLSVSKHNERAIQVLCYVLSFQGCTDAEGLMLLRSLSLTDSLLLSRFRVFPPMPRTVQKSTEWATGLPASLRLLV